MSTCKDCLHVDLCWHQSDSLFLWKKTSSEAVETICPYFAPKSYNCGNWIIATRSYKDDHGFAPFHDYVLCIEVTATCSHCGNRHRIGSDLEYIYYKFPPKAESSNADYEFNVQLEEFRALEFFNKNYTLDNFCPNCGYKMKEDTK